jgi:hypothetical protein
LSTLGKAKAVRSIDAERQKCIKDLKYLCTNYLDMKVLESEFSTQTLGFLDSTRDAKRVLLMAPRFSYKTLGVKARIIQEFLRNPDATIGYVHHTLDKAIQVIDEVAEILNRNNRLRGIFPRMMTPFNSKTAGKANTKWAWEGQILIPGRLQIGNQQPSVRAFSTGQDMTGQHFTLLIGDDIISKDTMEEMGGVEAIDRWWTSTAIPIIGATGRALLVGTRWTYDDLYAEAMLSDYWKVMHRGILETDGAPDPNGEPIPLKLLTDPDDVDSDVIDLTMEHIIKYREEMKGDFAAQMLNLPEPLGGRAWLAGTHEHRVRFEDIQDWVRQVIVLVDPAPKGANENHDYWANSVVAYYEEPKSPGILKRALIDGSFSQDWTVDDGMIDVLRLLKKWDGFGTSIVGLEEGLGAARNAQFFCNRLKEICRGKHRVMPIPFKLTQQKDSKNRRFADLASLAGSGWFVVADSCSPTFANLFFKQCRSHPDQYDGHDDLRDSVSYLNDSALDEHIPKASIPTRRRLIGKWNPFEQNRDEDASPRRSRYYNL